MANKKEATAMTQKDFQTILDIRIAALKESKVPDTEVDKETGEVKVIVLHRAHNLRVEALVSILMQQKHIQSRTSKVTYLDLVKPTAFERYIANRMYKRNLKKFGKANYIYSKEYNKEGFIPTLRRALYPLSDNGENYPVASLMKRIKRLDEKLNSWTGPVKIGIRTFVPKKS